MPARLRAWYTAAEIEALGAREACLRGEFKVTQLCRVAAYLRCEHGCATADFTFSARAPGYVGLEIDVRSSFGVTCQRCLEPFDIEISERVEFGVLFDESGTSVLPEGVEPLVLDGDRLVPLELVEDELIMAAPLVPRHASGQCALDTSEPPDGVFTDSSAERLK